MGRQDGAVSVPGGELLIAPEVAGGATEGGAGAVGVDGDDRAHIDGHPQRQRVGAGLGGGCDDPALAHPSRGAGPPLRETHVVQLSSRGTAGADRLAGGGTGAERGRAAVEQAVPHRAGAQGQGIESRPGPQAVRRQLGPQDAGDVRPQHAIAAALELAPVRADGGHELVQARARRGGHQRLDQGLLRFRPTL